MAVYVPITLAAPQAVELTVIDDELCHPLRLRHGISGNSMSIKLQFLKLEQHIDGLWRMAKTQ